MMRICLILYITGCMKILLVDSVSYNQRCTFSFDTCEWNIGRRWQVKNLDDGIDDKVLIATDRSNQDKEIGFTDIITSSWLYLTSICSYEIRLTFQFSIENEQDQIEVFLIKKSDVQISSIGQWKALTHRNSSADIESLWQYANITFKAAEEFRIEIEIRHFPDNKFDSTTWFALDDILIETCPNVLTTITSRTTIITTSSYSETNISSQQNESISFRFNHTFEDSLSSRLTLFSFIIYTISTLIGLSLIIILIAIIIFKYRKHCLPPSTPMINHRYHSSRRKICYHNSHIDQDARTERTMVTTIRPY